MCKKTGTSRNIRVYDETQNAPFGILTTRRRRPGNLVAAAQELTAGAIALYFSGDLVDAKNYFDRALRAMLSFLGGLPRETIESNAASPRSTDWPPVVNTEEEEAAGTSVVILYFLGLIHRDWGQLEIALPLFMLALSLREGAQADERGGMDDRVQELLRRNVEAIVRSLSDNDNNST